ncbi:hypothetical protein Tco_0524360 [Tanacetum coccineum]
MPLIIMWEKVAHIGYNCPPKGKVPLSTIRNHATIKPLMSSHKLCQVLIRHAILKKEIHYLMFQNLISLMILLTFLTHLYNLLCILVNFAGTMLVMVTIIPVCYDDDDDEESSIHLKDIIIAGLPPCVAIIPVLFTKEPVDSLIMEDEHLDTIPETKLDELIKSSVENLVQIPRESEYSSDGEYDLPPYDDSSKNHDLTFSNPLFDIDEDFTSSDESFSEEDVPNDNFKIFSNPLFDLNEEITSTKVDRIDDEIDSLLDEFAGELTLPYSIPPGIDDVNLDPEVDILFLESLLYDNSSSRPLEEFNSENPTESFSLSPIPVEDSDFLMEEIDIFFDGDDSIPPGIKSDDFDSEDDDNSTSRPEFESFHVDYPDSGDSTIDVVEDIPVDFHSSRDRNKIYDPGICIEVKSTRFLTTYSPVIDTLLPFSSENEDKVFNHGVLASKEKSPSSPSHRGLKAFQLSPESPMLISGDNTTNLGVRHPNFYPP